MQNNANLEFRKIPSLKFLYEVNKNGTIIRNIKSKKHLKTQKDENGQWIVLVPKKSGKYKRILISDLITECWKNKQTTKHPVKVITDTETLLFDTHSECEKWFINHFPNASQNAIHSRIRQRRHSILGIKLIYLSECRDCTR